MRKAIKAVVDALNIHDILNTCAKNSVVENFFSFIRITDFLVVPGNIDTFCLEFMVSYVFLI